MNYHIITFGCQMNKADTERIATDFEKKGYKAIKTQNRADLVLINMCSVRQAAVDRVYGQINNLLKLKKENPKLKIMLTGCILKQDKKKLKERVDAVLNKEQFLKLPPTYKNKETAFVPVSNGCNNFCAYCVVPFVRGPLVCRDHKKIIKEVKEALKQGQKEIWLLGQNVNDYHSPTKASINFSKLLEMVNNIPGKFSIRFTSPHPKNFSDQLIKVMAKSEKVAKYLNLPVQSGDNTILKRMNRPYTVNQYKTLVKKIRKAIPAINLSTDVIVGFPGETKQQFNNTVNLFKEMKFNLAYIAKYSPRPGTAAFQMKDNVPLAEKKRREKVLRKTLNKSQLSRA